jgi:hypothetical protein
LSANVVRPPGGSLAAPSANIATGNQANASGNASFNIASGNAATFVAQEFNETRSSDE